MKKWIIALLAILLLIVLSTYIFIPSKLTVSNISIIEANENGTLRNLSDENKWQKWWNYRDEDLLPTSQKTTSSFTCNNNSYKLSEKQYKSVKINIENKGRSIESIIFLIPLKADSTVVRWQFTVAASSNPFKRILDYQAAKEMKGCMNNILDHLKLFLQKKENVYGASFERTSFKDTLLISTKAISNTYPSTSFIYNLVKSLKSFAINKGALQTAAPIYNITKEDKLFNVMVALPVNKVLPDEGKFAFKKMIPGSFITTMVTGGEQSVNNAMQKIHQYFNDYHLTSMAINFKMLITDRSAESDTTKWVTKIYQPVY